MFRVPELRRLFRLASPRPDAASGDVDSEVEFHLAMRIEELKARGYPEPDARAEAVRRFGDVIRARTELAHADRTRAEAQVRTAWLADLWRDLRFAARELRRHWSFALVAIVVLGLGIGLTTTMVSLFDRLALHPLPYPYAERLGTAMLVTGTGDHSLQINPDRRTREAMTLVPGVERVYAHDVNQAMVEAGDAPEVVPTRLVSVGMLEELGAALVTGRMFAADDSAGGPLTTILSFQTWQRRFGGRPDVVGQTVRIEGQVATVIGVMRPGFDLTSFDGRPRADYWLPLRAELLVPGQDRTSVVIRRAASATMAALAKSTDARLAPPPGDTTFRFAGSFTTTIQSADEMVGKSRRQTLSLFLAAVGLVLLVACANIAALLLGQAAGRAQEFGVRAALGAGRNRVIRQLLAESALLAALGVGASVLVTIGMLALARTLRPADLLTIDEVRVNGTTFLLAAVIGLGSAIIFGLAPIWAVAETDAAAALVGRARRTLDGRAAGRLRSGLVVGQIAVTLILLVGAGLLVKSFVRERTLPTGLDLDGLAQIDVSLPERAFPAATRREQVIQETAERLRRTPGVLAVAVAGNGPLDFGAMQAEFLPDGKPWPETPAPAFMPMRQISPDFFKVTGQRLVAGSTVRSDTTLHQIIIDEATARRVWGSTDVIGTRVRFGRSGNDPGSTIVGVAANLRTTSDGFFRDVPIIYTLIQPGQNGATFVLRIAGGAALSSASRSVRDTDPGIRIRAAATTAESLAETTASNRFTMAIIAFFSALSLVLAMVGLYGVIAFAVRQRHFDFGVRLAIGAVPAGVRAMVLKEGAARIAAGVVVGLAGSAGLVRLIQSMLYRTSPWDPWVFGGAATLIGAVGLAAAWIPADRASRVDPLVAIRSE